MRVISLICGWVCCLGAIAQEETGRAVTTLDQQTSVSVTAYNNGLGHVKDVRKLRLPTGALLLEFQGVAEAIQPATVSLRSLSAEGSIVIHEQNYEYDLISPQKLMEKYVGKQVRLINFSNEIGFNEVTATLISTNNGPVYQIGEDIFLGHPGNVVLPGIPGNLIARPTLLWELQNAAAEQEIEVAYLTNGISWVADYVITIPREEQHLDLKGWVTLNNESGATYTNAQLKLVAGAVNLAPPPAPKAMRAMAMEAMDMSGGGMPAQEAFAEFHLYTMPRPATLRENQSKQLALLDAAGISFTKKYEFRGQEYWYWQIMPPVRDAHVSAFIEFENRENNKLGVPLPGGVMRIYQEDSGGTLQFAGEDRIQHTPKNEKVTLKMGEAFDIVVDRIQTDYRVIAQNVHESAYELTLRNHKSVDVTVELVENIPGDWRMLEESMKHVKKDVRTIVYPVPVPADGEVKVTYRVQVRN